MDYLTLRHDIHVWFVFRAIVPAEHTEQATVKEFS
jgi:hypothetical protein